MILEIARDALDLPAAERPVFIDHRCGADAALRDSIAALLDRIQDESTVPTLPESDGRASAGAVIGEFVIRAQIGEGAFGEVYLAERRELFNQQVALKILKHGMGSREILARFAVEREILARMDHPNVARVITGGRTADGRPWFAMEYVPGDPITKHSDDARLTIRDRIERFIEVCEGVQHAHQKGAIHRDIKPSNILVRWHEGPAVAKVIDFGIAKVLDRGPAGGSLYSELRRLVGTPAYMAPEQWGDTSQDVDTRTDIYGLGVVLYELLSGVLPFEMKDASLDSMRATILSREPQRPSARVKALPADAAREIAAARRTDPAALARMLSKDLDWIITRCLDKDRARRYPTAAALADDLRRYLAGEAVEAAPPGAGYIVRKFLWRYRVRLGTGALLAALVLASSWFGLRALKLSANERRQRAERLVSDTQLLAFRYPAQALSGLREARTLAPGLLAIDVAEAYALSMDNKHDEALARIEAVLQRSPGNPEALAILAGLLRESNPARAEELETKARALLPPERLHLLALGVRDDRKAVERLTESLDRFPWNFDAVFQRAVRRFALEDSQGALADAELLLKIRPDLDLVWNLAGAAALEADPDATRALEYFDEAVKMPPARALKLVNRSLARARAGRRDDALSDILAARALDPEDRDAMRQECQLHFAAEHWSEAAECFDRAVKLNACNVPFLQGLADSRIKLGKQHEALADLSEALRCAADLPAGERAQFHDRRADLHFQLDEFAAAFADWSRAFELDAERFQAASNAGWAQVFNGRAAEARIWLDRAVALAPEEGTDRAVARLRRAYAAFLAGDYGGAAREFDEIAAPAGWEFIGVFAWESKMRSGHKAQARQGLQRLEKRLSAGSNAPSFSRTALRYLSGVGTEATLLAAAGNDQDRLGAHYVLGARAAAEGRTQDARKWFERCAATPADVGSEVEYAKLRLRSAL